MNCDTTYTLPQTTRALQRAGRWQEALELLPGPETGLRAEILTDRFWWQLEGQEEAEQTVSEARDHHPLLAAFLEAQLAYTRLLFDQSPRPDDLETAKAGFTQAAEDKQLTGWGTFWRGVTAEHLEQDSDTSQGLFRRALNHAEVTKDQLLESYAIRHIGGAHAESGDHQSSVRLFRRSYLLRAALGARPQTATAALTLASALPPDQEDERDQLLRTARTTAEELGLTWLLRAL